MYHGGQSDIDCCIICCFGEININCCFEGCCRDVLERRCGEVPTTFVPMSIRVNCQNCESYAVKFV